MDALLTIEGEDHLTVGARLELILTCIATTDLLMVVDLAIHCQHLLAIGREQRLSPTLRIDDTQSLVGEDG